MRLVYRVTVYLCPPTGCPVRRSWGHDIEDLQELADNSVNVLAPEEFALLFGLESRLSPDTNRSCEAGHSMFDAMTHASDLKASEVSGCAE